MKRVLLLGLSAVALMTNAGRSFAQPQLGFTSLHYVGPTLGVTAPASIAGGKTITQAWDTWGGNPDIANITNIQVVKVGPDTLGCPLAVPPAPPPTTTNITTAVAGKVALVFRGGCEFGSKALNSQLAGAKAVIIVNNLPGDPVGMAAGTYGTGVTIPVFMVSQADGQAMNAQLNAGQTVTVTYTPWGLGLANDLAITPGSIALPHAQAMPRSQLVAGNGSALAYRNYVGAFVANLGTATQNNIKLRSVTSFMPTGSTIATIVRQDSITNASFVAADSIQDAQNVSPTSYYLNPSTNGTYTFRYSVSATAADGNLANNLDSVRMHVTDSVFSKGTYNPTTGLLSVPGGYGTLGAQSNAVYGPLFYVAGKNYKAAKVQYSIGKYVAAGQTNDQLLIGTPDVFATIYQWIDGRNGAPADTIMQGAELRPVALGSTIFAAGDSSYENYIMDLTDFYDDSKAAVMRDSGWYWVALTYRNENQALGYNKLNYFTRSYAASVATPRLREYWAPMVRNSATVNPSAVIDTASTVDSIGMFPFNIQDLISIDSVAYTYSNITSPNSENYTPAIAMHTSKDPVPSGIRETAGNRTFEKLELFPNPAKGTLNISYSLAEASTRLSLHIVNAMGQSVKLVEVNNPQRSGTVAISLADIAAGQYYLLSGANGKATGRAFTVVGK